MRTFLLHLTIFSLLLCSNTFCVSASSPDRKALFIKNVGQVTHSIPGAPDDVLYYAHFDQVTIFITPYSIVYQFNDGKFRSVETMKEQRTEMILLNSKVPSNVLSENKNDYTETHFNPDTGKTLVCESFEKITLSNVYPDIDWVIYIQGDHIKYDFVVKPGANENVIRFYYSNALSAEINSEGGIDIATPFGLIKEKKPISYLSQSGKISSAFKKTHGAFSFEVEDHFHDEVLTIDPDVVWTSYIGGSGFDEVRNSVIDEEGNIYTTGITSATEGIAIGGAQLVYGGGNYDAFIAKYDRDGALLWCSYLGGPQSDFGNSIALDNVGNIYLGGSTSSISGVAHQGLTNNYNGGTYDGFVAKFSSEGVLIWSTYIGGNGEDIINSIAVNMNDDIIAIGTTASTGLASSAPYQNNFGGGLSDVFIQCMESDGSLRWNSYFGGSGDETASTILFTADQRICIAGNTSSASNVALNGYQMQYGGGQNDGYLAQFDEDGFIIWSTYIGGNQNDEIHQLTINRFQHLYVSGSSSSTNDISTSGASQNINAGGSFDGIIGRFNLEGDRIWMSYFGGEGQDKALGIACDELGNVYLAGITSSLNNIAYNPFQQDIGGGNDLFFAFFDSTGVINWSSYLGGSSDEFLRSISADENSKIIFSGNSASSAAALNGWDTSYGGSTDGFFGKVQDCNNPYVTVDPLGETIFCYGESVGLSVGGADTFIWSTDEETTVITVDTTKTVYAIGTMNGTGCRALSNLIEVEALYTPTVTAFTPDMTTLCGGGSVTLIAVCEDEFESFEWSNEMTGDTIVVFEEGSYSVGAVAENGCIGRSENITITFEDAPVVQAATAFDIVCISVPAVNFIGLPLGGTFVGNGMVGNQFIPEMAGGGEHEIFYEWIHPETGCGGTSEVMNIEVLFSEVQLFVDNTEFCVFDIPMELFGFPEGGFYVGPGVSESTFFPELAGPGDHEIAYVVLDENGCYNRSEQIITVDACTSVDESEFAKSIRVYPNPANDYMIVESEMLRNSRIHIYDITGKEVLQQFNLSDKNNIDVSPFQSGVYTIIITNDHDSAHIKFIKS